MILSLLLGLSQAGSPPPAATGDVVVIGERQKTWRGFINARGGKLSCRTRRSTGDPEIDAIGCAAMTACYPAAEPRFKAAADRKLPADERKRLMAAANQSYGECMIARRDALIGDLADRRAAARSTGS